MAGRQSDEDFEILKSLQITSLGFSRSLTKDSVIIVTQMDFSQFL